MAARLPVRFNEHHFENDQHKNDEAPADHAQNAILQNFSSAFFIPIVINVFHLWHGSLLVGSASHVSALRWSIIARLTFDTVDKYLTAVYNIFMTTAIETKDDTPALPEERRGLRERQRQARDEAILEAAFGLIVEQGYTALTMEALAARVGISRQTLYHHFASREEITLRAILVLMEQSIAAIQAFDDSLSPVDTLKGVVRWMLESRSQPAYAALVKVKHLLTTIKTHPDYRRAYERREAALVQIVADAQSAGQIRADLPSLTIVEMLLGLVSGASYEDSIATGQITFTEVADAISDVFFTGLRP